VKALPNHRWAVCLAARAKRVRTAWREVPCFRILRGRVPPQGVALRLPYTSLRRGYRALPSRRPDGSSPPRGPDVATSGEDSESGARPAISECRCVRQVSPGVCSVPMLTCNQGCASTAVDDLTVDDSEIPANGDEQGAADSGQETSRQPEAGLPVRRAGRNSAHTSCTKSRSCGRRCHRRTRRRRGDARVWRIGGAWPRRRARPASVPAGASVCDVRRLRGVAKSGGGREVAFRPWLARRGRFGRPWPRQLSRRKPRPTRRSSAS